MPKKETKKAKEFNETREFAVILEKIYSELKILGEGQSALRDKLDATMGMVAKNAENITMLNINMSVIKDELNKINGKLAKLEVDLTDFNKRLSHLEALK